MIEKKGDISKETVVRLKNVGLAIADAIESEYNDTQKQYDIIHSGISNLNKTCEELMNKVGGIK